MKNVTIGIPRGLLYYRYKHLLSSFFKELGINILISPFTNEDRLESIKKELPRDICMPLKIYIDHVKYLINKVDYILIIRIDKEDNCYYFNSIYDVLNNKYDIKILDFNIDKKTSQEEAFIKMGHALGFGKQTSLNAYKIAKKQDYKQKKINYLLQQKKLNKEGKKVLIEADNYIYNDDYIKNNILKLNNIKNIEFIYSDIENPDKNNIDLNYEINKTICIIPSFCFKDRNCDQNKLFINLDDENIDKIINDYINDKENNCE